MAASSPDPAVRDAAAQAPAPPLRELHERLAALTLRDEHRLRRRLDRVRRGHAGPELDKLLAEIARGEARIARRGALVPARLG